MKGCCALHLQKISHSSLGKTTHQNLCGFACRHYLHARKTATETNLGALKQTDLKENPQLGVFKKFIRSSSH